MLGKRIAVGRTAEIYAWGDRQVVKLFRDWFPAEAAESEARIARAVYASGLPAPWVGDLIEVKGRRGLVYERLDGENMGRAIFLKPWRVSCFAQQFAGLHTAIHRIHTQEPPSQRTRLADKIRAAPLLSDFLKNCALKALAEMPEDICLCHGDFHPGNILLTKRGPMVIDWIDVTSGHPMADVARTCLIMGNAVFHMGLLGWIARGLIERFLEIYQEAYFQQMPGEPAMVERWLPIVAAARLEENIPQEKDALLTLVRESFMRETEI